MKIPTYVLHCAVKNKFVDRVTILGVSVDIRTLRMHLDKIAENKAREYFQTCRESIEEHNDRLYRITDTDGYYAEFYITERELYIPVPLMGTISREMERINRIIDVGEHLKNLYNGGGMTPWMYEYMHGNEEAMKEILLLLDEMEDCNTPFNTTMELAVGNVMKEIRLDDERLEYLWDKFGDVLIDDDGCILDGFLGFERGTHRETVWHWFDERYSGGAAGLMFGKD